jgi:hypothetical protein
LLQNQQERWGGQYLNTHIPRSSAVLDVLARSGVLAHVSWLTDDKKPPKSVRGMIGKGIGLAGHQGATTVNSVLAGQVKKQAMKRLEGGLRRGSRNFEAGRRIYKVLVEAMNNTAQHAGQPGREPWWLCVSEGVEGGIEVSFLDLGKGIVKTLPLTAQENIRQLLGRGASDAELLHDVVSGRLDLLLSRSGTRLPYRGNGFIEMDRAVREGYFRRLVIVANRAMVDMGEDCPRSLHAGAELSGTLIHLEVGRKPEG